MPFEPENILEESLVRAATQPEHRPQFYRDLVASIIFLIHVPAETEANPGSVPSDRGTIRLGVLEMNGAQYIPAFSSVTRLQAFAQSETAYVGLNALDFMKMIAGNNFVLNPGAEFGKEFFAGEIASIIDGSIWEAPDGYTVETVEKESEVMIGEPATYPAALVEELTRYFKTRKDVKRAYLAHFFNPARDEKPHTLIAVETSGDWDDLWAGAGAIASAVAVPDPPVDFTMITGNGGLEDYFTKGERTPFYQKKLFGLF